MKELPDACIDLVIADPPFGIDFRGKESQYNRDPGLVEDGYVEIDENYESFTSRWIGALPRIIKDTGSAYLVSGWTNLKDILIAIEESGLHLINHLIWKYQFGVFTKRKFVSSHYHILFVVKDEQQYFFNKYEYYPEDVWIIPRTYMAGQKKNGTKLPETLLCRFLNFSTKPGDLVLDPFMGNGTTAVCAKGLYRHYVGYEINDNMAGIHDNNLSKVKIGEFYRPLNEYLPSTEDLLEKYPHLRKHVEN
ncbi:site-specific DNA-methyltransferase [Candidatus Bathyarchaeota archaeon]|nr:site-specific DNA-methyltransferase [Candidatus Bathyarchaeota archaeon]